MQVEQKIDYLKGIAENDFYVLEKIYEECSPPIVSYVKKNSGTLDDARDVIQEGLIVVYKKLKNNDLQLTSSFQTYLYSICRFIWLKKLKKNHRKEVTFDELEGLTVENDFVEQLIENRKQLLFNKKLAALSEECRKVLKLFFNGKSGKQIAVETGYAEDYVKRKKYKCKEKLVTDIKSDPEFQIITE